MQGRQFTGSDARMLIHFRISRGEGRPDGGVSNCMASLYIGDELLDEHIFQSSILIVAGLLQWLTFKNSSRSGGHSQGIFFFCPSG
jgi:hypothetical protein